MEKLNANLLIKEAREKLAGKDATRLAAFHAAITVAVALAITVLQYVLSKGIGNTGGLSGMGTRSILETVQTVLQWANMILMPFWNLGFLYAALRWAKDHYARKEDLLAGFHRIGPYLGLMLNRTFLIIMVLVVCVNVSSMFYMMTPAAAELTETFAFAGNDMDAMYAFMETMTEAQMMQLLKAMIPMLVICGVLSLLLLTPLLYLFRFAEFVILDQPGARGLSSMILSATLLRRRCWQLFKLDLKLWWYYALQLLCELVFYGDLLLTAFGIPLPFEGDVLFLVTYGLYLVALFVVHTLCAPRVQTAYACAYEACFAMGPVQKKAVSVKPQDVPWDEE